MKVASLNYRELLPPIVLLTIFYTLAAGFALRPVLVNDPDLWWHLRTGQWIVEHQAWPLTDVFSQVGQGKPWIAYSWLFEVMLYGVFAKFGLAGILGMTALLALAIVAALVLHVRPYVASDKQAVLYSGLGVLALASLCNPRPWLFTLLFFILEYSVLLAVRRTGRTRLLWCLPPLFALWANLHIQFIYGLFLLCFDAVEPLLASLWRRDLGWATVKAQLPARRWAPLLACFAATLATPYHVKVYGVIGEIAGQAGVYKYVTELRPLSFSSLTPWAVLALALWAMFRLGWRRLEQPTLLLLLMIGIALAFRSNRDVWFLAITSVTVLALMSAGKPRVGEITAAPRWAVHASAVLLTCLALLGRGYQAGLTNTALQSAVAGRYPVAAAQVIEARGYAGPLFNHFDWGGYLIWRLPQLPVSMDGRTNIYGPAGLARHSAVWGGSRGWAQDRELEAAGLVIANLDQPLCELLRFDQRFELVYEDNVAAVFIARQRLQAQR